MEPREKIQVKEMFTDFPEKWAKINLSEAKCFEVVPDKGFNVNITSDNSTIFEDFGNTPLTTVFALFKNTNGKYQLIGIYCLSTIATKQYGHSVWYKIDMDANLLVSMVNE